MIIQDNTPIAFDTENAKPGHKADAGHHRVTALRRHPEISSARSALPTCGVNVSPVALHASLGFQQAGLLPEAGRKFGEWLRLLIMQRPLQ
jgi:hypothetical protein